MNAPAVTAHCPRCGIALASTPLAWLAACARCGGVFAHRTMPKLGAKEAEAARAVSAAAGVRPSTQPAVRCPVCSGATSREKLRGVEVWFDRDEIEHVTKGTMPHVPRGALAAGAAAAAIGAGGAVAMSAQRGSPQTQSTAADLLSNAGDVVDAIDVADVAGDVLGGVLEIVVGLFD